MIERMTYFHIYKHKKVIIIMISAATDPPSATPSTSASISHLEPMKFPLHLHSRCPLTTKHSPLLEQYCGEQAEQNRPDFNLSCENLSSYPASHSHLNVPKSLIHLAFFEQSFKSLFEHSFRSSTLGIAFRLPSTHN